MAQRIRDLVKSFLKQGFVLNFKALESLLNTVQSVVMQPMVSSLQALSLNH